MASLVKLTEGYWDELRFQLMDAGRNYFDFCQYKKQTERHIRSL